MTATMGQPRIQVVKGEPSDDELAALVVALLTVADAANSSTTAPECCPVSGWVNDRPEARQWTPGTPWAMSLTSNRQV